MMPRLAWKRSLRLLVLAVLCLGGPAHGCTGGDSQQDVAVVGSPVSRAGPLAPALRRFALPAPSRQGNHSLAQLLQQRRSVRDFAATPLALAQVGQLLWAAQGITASGGLRTAPSAGALYPLELYVVAGRIDGLPAGLYHYDPHAHGLVLLAPGDRRRALASAAVRQMWLADAPAVIVFSAVPPRTSAKYGARAERFIHIEIGHAAENLFLQAEDLQLGTAVVGSFDDAVVARVLQLGEDVAPLLLMPVGVQRLMPAIDNRQRIPRRRW